MCHTRGARLRPTTPVIITNSHCRTSKTILQKYFICQNYLKLVTDWLVMITDVGVTRTRSLMLMMTLMMRMMMRLVVIFT